MIPVHSSPPGSPSPSARDRCFRWYRQGIVRAAIANIGLRGLTLASRAVFIIFFARFLTPSELGVYGLFATTIGLLIYILGFDFYSFTTREILASPSAAWGPMLRDQAVFHGIVYVVVLPAILLLFRLGTLPSQYLLWFYALLIGEHLGQELYRLLLTLSRSSLANFVYFIRAGAWIYVFVAWALLSSSARTLHSVWICWGAGQLLSLIFGAWALREIDWYRVADTPVNRKWLQRGARLSFRLLGGTVATWAITTIDRQFLEKFSGSAMVGVYSFYMSVASAAVTFAEAGIVAPIYPRLIASWHRSQVEFNRTYASFNRISWAAAIVLVASAVVGIGPVLRFVNKPIYAAHQNLFWVLMGYAAVSIAFRPQHFALYARTRDAHLTASAVAGLIVAAMLDLLLVKPYGVLGIAVGTLSGASVIVLWKFIVLSQIERRENLVRAA